MHHNFFKMKIRKLLRILHRDLGYFIVAMTVIYAVSGIYLNHRRDFNPDYKIFVTDFKVDQSLTSNASSAQIKEIVEAVDENVTFKKHYVNNEGNIKIFVENGEAIINPNTGKGTLQYLQKRPIIFGMNKMHRANLGTVWKWISDLMAVILIFVAVSGLFLLKGKRGFNRWGWWLTIAGIVVPLLFLILFV